MATEYYLLKEPITYVVLKKQDDHTHMSIFITRVIGELVLREEEVVPILRMLIDEEPLLSQSCAKEGMVTHWFHDARGFQKEQLVVSEYGELTTLGKIGAK